MGGKNGQPINLVGQIADELLPAVLRKMSVTDTAANRADILALALNGLPTKYVTSGGGKLYAELIENYRIQYQADVLQALVRAAIKVKGHPRGAERAVEHR